MQNYKRPTMPKRGTFYLIIYRSSGWELVITKRELEKHKRLVKTHAIFHIPRNILLETAPVKKI